MNYESLYVIQTKDSKDSKDNMFIKERSYLWIKRKIKVG